MHTHVFEIYIDLIRATLLAETCQNCMINELRIRRVH